MELPEGHYYGVVRSYGEPVPREIDIPEFEVSESSPTHVYRVPGVYVSGQVMTPEGAVLTGGDVSIQGNPTVGEYEYIGFAYAGSTFRALVKPGVYWIAASGRYPSPYAPAMIDSIPLTNDTTITFQLVGTRVEGRITGRGGAPLPGAKVRAEGATTSATGKADDSGQYFLYVPGGSYRWTVSPPDSMQYVLPRHEPSVMIAGPTARDFSLDGALWSGILVSEESGAPRAGWSVTAFPWGYENRSATSRTTYAGEFRLVLERGLEYDILVKGPYGEWVRSYRAGVAGADSTFTLTVPATSSGTAVMSRRDSPLTPTPPAARAAAE